MTESKGLIHLGEEGVEIDWERIEKLPKDHSYGLVFLAIRNEERERCAKIAEAYAEGSKGPLSSISEEIWGTAAGKEIARKIRGS